MDFVSNQKSQLDEMLKAIGVGSVEELFAAIPDSLKLPPLEKDDGISEYEGICHMEAIASKNHFHEFDNYLGAGSYEHHVPAIVSAICSKSEFLTSYTPYQPESSQGGLQTIFEYQSAICALTGLDASNASLYDGASACAEGLLMAIRAQKNKNKILISSNLHPHYKDVIEQYLSSQKMELLYLPPIDFEQALDCNTVAILIQSPNFFGVLEEVKNYATQAKAAGALTILCANPLSYGIFASAGELGADIAVGDCQPFGIPMQFGGPYVGYIACKEALIRQLPGRIAGETIDSKGRRGFVLTLQAREQHIRREKATSNICTNQALSALACLITLLWYGKKGVSDLSLMNFQKASYLREKLASITGVITQTQIPIFNEFTLHFNKPAKKVQEHFRKNLIEPGLHLGEYYPKLKDHFLVAVTETKSEKQLDKYLKVCRELYENHL